MATPPRIPVRIALLHPDKTTTYFPTREAKLSHSTAWYFWVPEDCKAFTIDAKLVIFGAPVRLHIRDGEGREVAVHEPGRTPSREWEPLTFHPEASQRGQFWRIAPRPYLPQLQDIVLRFDGVPNLVSPSAPTHPPPPLPPAAEPPSPSPPPIDSETPPIAIAGGVPLEVDIASLRGGTLPTAELPRTGSLSFWIYPEWDTTDYTDAVILGMGELRIVRQVQHTTTVQLGRGQRLFTGFVVSPWNWYHIRLSWNLDAGGEERGFTLWIDGVPMARNPSTDPAILESWRNDTIRIGGDHPFRIAGLEWLWPHAAAEVGPMPSR